MYSKKNYAFIQLVLIASLLLGHVYCIRLELLGQDNIIIRLCHGTESRHEPNRKQLPMAELNVRGRNTNTCE